MVWFLGPRRIDGSLVRDMIDPQPEGKKRSIRKNAKGNYKHTHLRLMLWGPPLVKHERCLLSSRCCRRSRPGAANASTPRRRPPRQTHHSPRTVSRSQARCSWCCRRLVRGIALGCVTYVCRVHVCRGLSHPPRAKDPTLALTKRGWLRTTAPVSLLLSRSGGVGGGQRVLESGS